MGRGGVILESLFFNEGSNLAFLQFLYLNTLFLFCFCAYFYCAAVMNWLQREINKSSVLIVYDSLSVLLYSF